MLALGRVVGAATFCEMNVLRWPEARTWDQEASASESEVVHIYPHQWARPRDARGRLLAEAPEEIGVWVHSGLLLADDAGAVRMLGNVLVLYRPLRGRENGEIRLHRTGPYNSIHRAEAGAR
ncbi:hypothetical protein ACWGH8_36855 [Nonomuraea muscovyensis]|uniref:hypothetical protein n=1 Tax=Nonomuraea muscovyensis TaxID=1124761 RepID=UPI0033D73169